MRRQRACWLEFYRTSHPMNGRLTHNRAQQVSQGVHNRNNALVLGNGIESSGTGGLNSSPFYELPGQY